MLTKKYILSKLAELKPALYGVFNRKIDLVTKNALKRQIKDRILKQVYFV